MEARQAHATSRTILVVDDSRDAVTMLGLALRLKGYQVHEAYTGASAIELARRVAFDTMVIDMKMPGMSGSELAKQIRTTLGNKVRLIALTGHTDRTIRRESREAGFDYYVLKPISCEDLVPYIEADPYIENE